MTDTKRPRDFWINFYDDGIFYQCCENKFDLDKDFKNVIHVREVLESEDTELERLKKQVEHLLEMRRGLIEDGKWQQERHFMWRDLATELAEALKFLDKRMSDNANPPAYYELQFKVNEALEKFNKAAGK